MARFLPYLLPTLLAISMLALLLWLGFWQLDRASYKEALLARELANQDLPAIEITNVRSAVVGDESYFRLARIRGRFDAPRQYLLDNRTHNGRAGYHVISPLSLGDGVILVNRGWVALGASRGELPTLEALPAGQVVLQGRLSPPPGSGLLLGESGHEGASAWPRVVQTVDLGAMERALGQPVAPLVLLLDTDDPGCHVCTWAPVRGSGPEKHRGYAVQWFALAAALLVLCAVALRRQGSHER